MRTAAIHAFVVPLILFGIYLALNFWLNPQYAKASLSYFLADNVKTITWSCAVFFLAITFDFLRRATHEKNYAHVNGEYFLWSVTIALLFQLVLAAGQGVMLMNGTSTLLGLLNGYEGIILSLIIGTAAMNAIAYAVGVDMNS